MAKKISRNAKLEKRTLQLVDKINKRSYDGAKTGRRTGNWVSAGNSANAEIAPALSLLRNRSRELVRNNPYAAKAMRVLCTNYIGTGITANIKDKKVAALYKKWIKECDADGHFDLYGLQRLIARAEPESGECLVRIRYRKASDGLSVPMQLQVLEADYLDSYKFEDLPNGGWIQHGIEYDGLGRRAAYWMYKQHPGDMSPKLQGLESFRVPAEDVIHFYDKTRPGQARGVPVLAPSMLTANDLDDYLEATLVRKGAEACIAAFVKTDDENRNIGIETADSNNERIEELSPVMVQYLNPGEEISFSNPSTSTGDVGYTNDRLHAIAVGAGVTYEQMTGDLSQVNYSSIRAGTLDFRREVEQWQWINFIPIVCEKIFKKFLDVAVISGKIKSADVDVEWTTPRFDWVDPVKDVQGEGMEIGLGLKTWAESVRGRGYDPDKVFEDLIAEKERFAKAGITHPMDNVKVKGIGGQNEPPPDTPKN